MEDASIQTDQSFSCVIRYGLCEHFDPLLVTTMKLIMRRYGTYRSSKLSVMDLDFRRITVLSMSIPS